MDSLAESNRRTNVIPAPITNLEKKNLIPAKEIK